MIGPLQPRPDARRPFFWIAACAVLLATAAESSAQSHAPIRRARPPDFDPTILELLAGETAPWPQDPLPTWMDVARGEVRRAEAPADFAASPPNADVPEGPQWSELADAATIEDEIKFTALALRNPLADATTFSGGGYREVRDAFVLLERLFQVAAEFDKSIRWSEVAAEAASRFAAAADACTGGDAASFRAATTAGDVLQRLIQSSSLAPGDGARTLSSDLAPLMKRLESAQRDRLRRLLTDERAFRDREALFHEAAIAAVLARDMTSSDFGYDADDSFAAYAEELAAAAQSLRAAALRSDFNAAREAYSAMGQSCDACHGDYR